ncbi:MAG: iron uptake porin [Iphinoe sp. HA4291-MV1]|jgi:porin|nr:iron uptake porin [Iphinoe sp. HA4291-MV1]
MKKIYLFLTESVGILCLILQSTSVLAETSQTALVSFDPVITGETVFATSPNALKAGDNVIEVSEPILESSLLMAQTATEGSSQKQSGSTSTSENRVTSVSQLSDVQPQDWAFQALQSLVERYGVIAGYSDSTYRGNRAITRYEFAAGLNAVLNRVNELIAAGLTDQVSCQDLLTLEQLQKEFAAELTSLQSRIDNLEANTANLEANQFSTTTKLSGQAVFAITGGTFSGDRIIGPRGEEISNEDPNFTVPYRVLIDLTTSFVGNDQLLLRIETGSDGVNDNASGFLEPNFGSGLGFSIRSGGNDSFIITRANYSFKPFEDLTVVLGPTLFTVDYFDRNRYANNDSLDFGTLAFQNNYVVIPYLSIGSGAVISWNPGKGPFTMRAGYVAEDAANPNPNVRRPVGISALGNLLFPNRGGEGGLFGSPSQTLVELEYAPSTNFTLRLLYNGGTVSDGHFDAFGANFELALSERLGIFGRYGYGSYYDTVFGDINPNYWMAGVAFPDLFTSGALAGVAVGQPFIEGDVGNATQTNMEVFYTYPVNDNIHVTPLIQVVTNPGNQESNGTIVTGTLRTTFSF